MSKKKILQLAGAVVVALILAVILIPVVFKGKIISSVKQMANETLLARLDFKEAEVSLFSSFPQLEVRLKELTITGINEFDGKTLLQVETMSTSVSLSSLWKSDGLTVSEIILKDPRINLLVSPEGKANWDIGRPSASASSAEGKSPMKIELNKIQLINTILTYGDDQSKMHAGLKGGNFDLSGFLKGSDSQINFAVEADSIALLYDGKKLISGMKVSGEGALQSNFDQMSFRFLGNKFKINQLPLEFQGSFVMGDQSDQYDLSFQSNGASLDELLSFLPGEQQEKLKPYDKSGTLSFSGLVKGTYSDTTYPAIDANLKLANGRLKYPSKSNEINKIEMEARLSKPQGTLDSLVIAVSKMEANIAGHPVIANLTVTSPVSNPFLKGDVVGEIDFASLKNTIPIDTMEISGIVRANIHFDGPYSAIDKGEYDKFQTKGSLSVLDFSYRSPSFPDRLGIRSAALVFNSKEITISSMQGKLGVSDFTVDGSFSDYWAYLLKEGTIHGNIKVKSDLLDVTQLMNGGTQSADTLHSEPYVIPAGIDLTMQAAVDRMLYNKMEIRGTAGKLIIKDQKLNLDQLSMNLLKGRMVLSGIYSAKEKEPADFNFKIDIRDFDLPTAYQSVGMVRHLLPFAGNSKGTFGTGISLSGTLGKDYAPYFASLNGNGLISIKNLELVGNNMFAEIGKYFRKDLFTNVKVNDFASNITITNGALAITPFSTKIANQEVTISGNQSLAMDLNYQLNFKVNKNDLSSDVSGFIGLVPGTENIDKYPIKINVVGNMKKPEVKVDISEAKSLVENEFKKKAKSSLQDVAKKLGLDNLFK
ncbi:MAG TPA: AsmA family protein [Prolixibacteraceae bacterium]|nr:AsmA family protein [Prolixibacteraceae bacterium]